MIKTGLFKTKFHVIAIGISFILGVVITSFFWYIAKNMTIRNISAAVKPLRQKSSSYSFISPLLGYEVPSEIKEFNEYKPLEKKITSAVQGQASQPDSYSIYFRDLSLGRWVGIDEDNQYAPASMMKVVIMIAYFKRAETDPSSLTQQVAYSTSTADEIAEVPFQTPSNLVVGSKYTILQLIDAMITQSDNGAKNVLLSNIDQGDLDEIYTDLGLPNPAASNNYVISPKQYSLLLRILYNATYLSRGYSEQALEIMSRASFSQGLVTGLPASVKIAQKYGEHVDVLQNNSSEITLSNCGIIYHTTHPYILCVMVKSKDANVASHTIANISKTVWDEVSWYASRPS